MTLFRDLPPDQRERARRGGWLLLGMLILGYLFGRVTGMCP